MTDFGAGPALSENFDFRVDSSGDINTISGVAELEKDLAFSIANTVDSIGLGGQFTESLEEDLRIEIGLVIKKEPRIDELRSLTIAQDSENKYELNITIVTTAGGGPFDLVIPFEA